ncbi:MAG: hypothetical protein MRY72_13130 [Aquisalinus sp.]|nr:hypothetical protein [Aquisalinus sp.]
MDKAGDVYEIRLERKSKTSGEGSSGSSSSKSSLIERVIEVNPDGLILEFDLPLDSSAEDRAREWQFPARVNRALDGSLSLANAAELESRNQDWLERGNIDPSNCGRWVFTWTAVKIECDPQSVLRILEPFDLRIDNLRAGAQYMEYGALAPQPLALAPNNNSNGKSFVVKLDVDPDTTRLERAESDIIVAEIMGDQPPSLDEALQARSAEKISGTITVTIDTDGSNRVARRVRIFEVETTKENGSVDQEVVTETVQRELVISR